MSVGKKWSETAVSGGRGGLQYYIGFYHCCLNCNVFSQLLPWSQRLSFNITFFYLEICSRCFVPTKKLKKRFASQNLPIKNKRKPLGPGYLVANIP